MDNEAETPGMTPDAASVRAQLEKVLASDAFATAGRHSRLLRYVTERSLAGEGDQLKEYVLGTEVFDRADSYDPRLDSIVRVEARRLRSRLEEYYREAGANDLVLITIPRGSYAPVFTLRVPSQPPDQVRSGGPSGGAIASGPPRQTLSPAVIIAAALSVGIGVIAAGLALNQNRAPAQAATGPGIAVLPFEHFSGEQRDALLVAQLTDAVTSELARLGTVSVASRTSAARYRGTPQSVIEVARSLNVDFVMEASAAITADDLHVVARLVDGRLDRKVWVGEYDFPRADVLKAALSIHPHEQ
jgi:TolB-like protein